MVKDYESVNTYNNNSCYYPDLQTVRTQAEPVRIKNKSKNYNKNKVAGSGKTKSNTI